MCLSPCSILTCPLRQTQSYAFSHFISPYSNDALSPPRIVASATHSRGHVSVVGVGVETVVPPLPTPAAVYSIISLRRAHTPATRSATVTQPQSLSPVPLRTPLRLLPRQGSAARCHGSFVLAIVQRPQRYTIRAACANYEHAPHLNASGRVLGSSRHS